MGEKEEEEELINFPSKTDKELVSFCQRGYRKAFDELISRHGEYLKMWIFKFSKGNQGLSDDIFSSTLTKGWLKIKTFKGNSTFKTWMSAIARNCFYDEYRRSKQRKFLNIEDVLNLSYSGYSQENEGAVIIPVSLDYHRSETKLPSESLENTEESQEKMKIIKKIFSKLKPKEKEILFLKDIQGECYAGIAKTLNIPIGTVMSRLYYARRRAFKVLKSLPK